LPFAALKIVVIKFYYLVFDYWHINLMLHILLFCWPASKNNLPELLVMHLVCKRLPVVTQVML